MSAMYRLIRFSCLILTFAFTTHLTLASNVGAPKSPQQYGAKGDGIADDTAAFRKCLAENDNVLLYGTYKVSATQPIRSGQNIESQSARIVGKASPFLLADQVDDWVIQGKLSIVGEGNKGGNDIGLHVIGGKRYRVTGMVISGISGFGLKITEGTHLPYACSDAGTFTDCAFLSNQCGVETTPLRGTEYINFNNITCGSNNVGAAIGSGNINWVGGNITNNQVGIILGGTLAQNNSHGMFTSVNINHNVDYNLISINADYGHSFTACHFYGEKRGSIKIEKSKGLSFANCIIDGEFRVVDDFGFHLLQGCQLEKSFMLTVSNRNRVGIVQCFDKTTGWHAENDKLP